MPLPKLSPLQSRLAASLGASVMLLMLYLAFASPHFAYAAELDSIRPEDHNHDRILEMMNFEEEEEEEQLDVTYEADFMSVDRGIIGRQAKPNDPIALVNNVAMKTNVEQGKLLSYVFPKLALFGPKSPATPGLPSVQKPTNADLREKEGGNEGRVEAAERKEKEAGLAKVLEKVKASMLEDRQDSSAENRTLWITVTTCLQPSPIKNTTTSPPPQLKLYISESQNNTNPGPKGDAASQDVIELEGGYARYKVEAYGDVFFGLYGENTTNYKDVWNAHIAASIDGSFHSWRGDFEDPNLFMVDSDSGSALLVTDNLVDILQFNATPELYKQWLESNPPYVIFASPSDDANLQGLERSFCAWDSYAAMGASVPGKVSPSQIQSGMTARGVEDLPKEQFYVESLKPGKEYKAVLAMRGNSTSDSDGTVGGGGQVFRAMTFSTQQDGNCGVVFNLSFCSASAYSVPANPSKFPDMPSLAAFYDNYTQKYYENFEKVLAQTACETTSTSQYSLARTCDHCKAAYKRWLCTVTIPRCTDFSSPHPWLAPRAMSQPFQNGTFLPDNLRDTSLPSARNSRNPTIDEKIQPGPYKEVLPCDDLCYDVVQSCPASMGFSCPVLQDLNFNQSYGHKPMGIAGKPKKDTKITCNYPGVAYFLSGGQRVHSSTWGLLLLAALGVGVMLL